MSCERLDGRFTGNLGVPREDQPAFGVLEAVLALGAFADR